MRDRLKAEYRDILASYLGGAGEAAVLQAYDFARNCLRNGLAPDDVVEMHVDLVENMARSDETVRARAQSLLLEVVMAFSMGYRQTLEALELTNKELERVSGFKTRMLSMVAHDLTNHIMAIKIFAAFIARKGGTPDEPERTTLAGYGQNILDVVRDQETLVQNLLDIGRIDTGRMHLSISPQPLLELVERCVAMQSKTTQIHTITVKGESLAVLGDRPTVQRVLDNLVGNAIKYSPDGGEIAVSVMRADAYATVEVRDCGIGISAEDLPHVGEPFFRGTQAARSGLRGTGLGLSIVRSLVELQGGTLQLESQPGVGTAVRFTLPLAPTVGESHPASAVSHQRS